MVAHEECYGSVLLKRIHESDYQSETISLTAEKDNEKFSIHTIVLAAASKHFPRSLGPDFTEGKKNEYVLEGTDGETVKAIVDYCYTGQINLTEANVGKFLAIASSVELDLLEKECRRFYDEKLCVANCVDAFVIADKYSYTDIRQKAFSLICGNFEKFSADEVQKWDHRLLMEVLQCDEIQASEELLFTRLMEWFREKEDDRTPHMPELLKLIRLQLIPQEFLNGTLEAAYRKFNCSDIVFVEYKRRVSTQSTNIGVRRFGSILCLFTQFKGENGAERSAVKIEKLSNALNSLDEVIEIVIGNRTDFGAVLHENKIFVLGGRIKNAYSKLVSAFDLNTGEEEILPEMNFARGYFTPISHGKHIYVFGGFNGSNQITSCECFDTEVKTWRIIKEMNYARYSHSVTKLDDYFCVAGGFSDGQRINAVEVYDPKSNEWTQKTPMNKSRNAFALIKSSHTLFALGNDDAIEAYNSWSDRWTEIGAFEGCNLITNGVIVHDEFFAIKSSGQFGRVTVGEGGAMSFAALGQSKYQSKVMRRHFLFRN